MKKQLLSVLWAVSLPLAALADGKVFHASQTYARIPTVGVASQGTVDGNVALMVGPGHK